VLPIALAALAACSRPPAPVVYACAGGDSLAVAFWPRFAELRLPPDRVVRLPPERAASGARYSDGRYTLHTKGDEATLERGTRILLAGCRVRGSVMPPDSMLTPTRARALADSLATTVAGREPERRTLGGAPGGTAGQELRLWAAAGRPVVLRVRERGQSDSTEMSYFFVDGRLEVVRGPATQYVFRDTTLIFWTTDSLQPLADLPLRDMEARQHFVLGEVRQYLAMFGLEPEGGP